MKHNLVPLGTNPLLQTLGLLQGVDDDRVLQWGKSFDWTQPTLVTFSGPNRIFEQFNQPASILVGFDDERLTGLLLRPDMFDRAVHVMMLSDSKSPRHRVAPNGLTFSRDELWGGVMVAAAKLGNVDLMRTVSGYWKLPQEPNELALEALTKALSSAPPAARTKALNAVLTPSPSNPLGDWLIAPANHKLRENMAVRLAQDVPLAQLGKTLDCFGQNLPRRTLFDMLCNMREIKRNRAAGERAMAIAEAAHRAGGFFDDRAKEGGANWILEGLARFLGRLNLPEEDYHPLAKRLLAWQAERAPEYSHARFVEQLLEGSAQIWDTGILQGVRKISPEPSLTEMACLMLDAKEDVFRARALDFMDRPEAFPDAISGLLALGSLCRQRNTNSLAIDHARVVDRCMVLADFMETHDRSTYLDLVVSHLKSHAGSAAPALVATVSARLLNEQSAPAPTNTHRVRL